MRSNAAPPKLLVMDETNIYFDLETGGLDQDRHPVIQIAAVAVDALLRELETFEIKVCFNEAEANPATLQKNHYCRQLWKRRGVEPLEAAQCFAAFLRRHATVDMFSKDGRRYQVAQLVAHNGDCFDGPFLHAWYQRLGVFCPARYMVLCTKQRALWLFDEDKSLTPPANYKLGTLCEYFGVRLRDSDAHDAFHDVRATVQLYRAMRGMPHGKKQHAA